MWDFLIAVKGFDSSRASAYQTGIELGLRKDANDYPSLTDALEAYRNNVRISQAGSKSAPAASFATFQGDSPGEATTNTPMT
jgi:hypothetical protein